MARQHTPQQQFREAKQIAMDHGLFVVEKAGRFSVYRRNPLNPQKPTYVGACASAETLRRLVCKAANFR